MRDGWLDIDGRLPNNTHGGLLSEAYIHGLNNIAEGVRLIRGEKDTTVVLSVIPTSDRTGTKVVKIDLVRDEINLEDQLAKHEIVKLRRPVPAGNSGWASSHCPISTRI